MFKFDTHMHFDLYNDRQRLLEYLENSKSFTLAVTNLPELYERYRGIDKKFKYINIALGFHPELVEEYVNQLPIFEKYISEVRYVGEIGLDYSDRSNKFKQKEVFKHLISLAKNNKDKILTIHSRKAEDDILDITADFPGTVILHWYSGSKKNMERAIDENKYFSINHQMLGTKKGRMLIEHIPVERILIESDAPFTRGLKKEYSVSFMELIYKEIALVKHISTDELYYIFKENFRSIFQLL